MEEVNHCLRRMSSWPGPGHRPTSYRRRRSRASWSTRSTPGLALSPAGRGCSLGSGLRQADRGRGAGAIPGQPAVRPAGVLSGGIGALPHNLILPQNRLCLTTSTCLNAEFPYTVKKQELLTPDWILSRPGRALVLFECKSRRPTLPLQRRVQGRHRGRNQRGAFEGAEAGGRVPRPRRRRERGPCILQGAVQGDLRPGLVLYLPPRL
jgi:hypothetical protein